jgi:hypothetical protein
MAVLKHTESFIAAGCVGSGAVAQWRSCMLISEAFSGCEPETGVAEGLDWSCCGEVGRAGRSWLKVTQDDACSPEARDSRRLAQDMLRMLRL